MILSQAQQYASPEEALKHYGVKGMRWGVVNEDDLGGKDAARRNDETKRKMAKKVSGKIAVPETKDASGRITTGPTKLALSNRQQRRVDNLATRSDVANTKISELKRANESLAKTGTPIHSYNRDTNIQTIKSLDKTHKQALRDAESVHKHKLTSTQKKLIVGAVGVSAILGAQAIYRGQQSGSLNSLALRGSARLRGQKIPFNVDKSLSGRMSAKELLERVAKPVNPGYSTPGGQMNCRRSTYAYELRRRGFNVHATTSALGWGQSESGVINAVTPGSRNFSRSMSMSQSVVTTGFSSVARGDRRSNPLTKILLDDLRVVRPSFAEQSAAIRANGGRMPAAMQKLLSSPSISSSHKVLEELAKQPNGARGEVVFKFNSFGHSMAYEVVDGVPHIFDSQKGTLYNAATKMVESKWDGFSAAEITRLDNVDLDLAFLSRWATNVGG